MSIERAKRYTPERKNELLELFRQSGRSATRFCKEQGLSYPTLKRWLGPAPREPVSFVEIGQAPSNTGRMSVALPGGLWLEFGADCEKSVVTSWIRELKAC
ncbi:MAG: transposase [Cyanothece sp. SIO2G6]|nr:transposase [Cyanothece sp. SIO2G6]